MQKPSVFEKIEATRMIYNELDDTITKLAKFFYGYSKN